ncbi:MAG: hypothetical protein LBH25_09480 [Fibromonadaceae bacterium]|jgi:hypothetical protein|nr:hypothetical protein [Fibromonadaceae bacterium]
MSYLLALLFAVQFLSCGEHGGPGENPDFAKVTFYNESSYSVTIYQDHFDGFVLADKLASGMSHTTKLSPSNNYGIGSTFSIEYWFMVASGTEVSGGENIWTSSGTGIDNQIPGNNLESGKSYTIIIPQPTNWRTSDAFIRIINKSENSIEFNHLGTFYRLDGSLENAVLRGKVGVYKVRKVDQSENYVEVSGRTITQVSKTYPFPDFIAVDGHIYTFEFDGIEVRKTGDDKL